jgi:peroxiredoxin
VLSDSDAKMIEAFRVARKVEGLELLKLSTVFGVDLEAHSGRTHHEIAIPSLFLIDQTGVVRWAHADPEFKVRPTTAQMLAAIDAARALAQP